IADYEEKFPALTRLLLAYKADPRVGLPCPCGNVDAMRNTQCRDCRQYDLSCEACWVKKHENNPFHWAHIWNPTLRFFVKHDISAVDGGTHTFSLGHHGKPCPNADQAQKFTIVEPNGIHATKLHFCGCAGHASPKYEQLMQAGYFPATTRNPVTAFSFEVLKRFHLASLESKSAAYE
ncbi:hypothetical protein C8J57DRAFT_983767, partial [Mycena rebaudengoi]